MSRQRTEPVRDPPENEPATPVGGMRVAVAQTGNSGNGRVNKAADMIVFWSGCLLFAVTASIASLSGRCLSWLLPGEFGVRSEVNIALTPSAAEVTGGEAQRELLRLLP